MDVLEIDDSELGKLKDRTKKVFSAEQKKTADNIAERQPKENPEKPTPASPESTDRSPKTKSDLFKDVFGSEIDLDNLTK